MRGTELNEPRFPSMACEENLGSSVTTESNSTAIDSKVMMPRRNFEVRSENVLAKRSKVLCVIKVTEATLQKLRLRHMNPTKNISTT